MRKITLYIAQSLNGYIADLDSGVDWLDAVPNPEKDDFGYPDFYGSIDTTIMGYNTFQQITGWGIEFPYKGKKNFVLTQKTDPPPSDEVEFITLNHLEFIRKLRMEEGGAIWLIGGGQINTLLLNAGLIDELYLFVMPVVLPGGIKLFASMPHETSLELRQCKQYSNGVVELRYTIIH